MQQRPLTRQEVRQVDRIAIEQFAMPGIVLMENAGRGCVEAIWGERVAGPYVICCGKGNNGGDGFVIARHLANRGQCCKILLCGQPEELSGDALQNYLIAKKASLRIDVLSDDVSSPSLQNLLSQVGQEPTGAIIDAMLGTGAVGFARPPFSQIIDAANLLDLARVAIDIPSGLDCDTGAGSPIFKADLTCTFVASKPGLETPNGRKHCGKITVVDIGIPPQVVELAIEAVS